MRRIRLKSWARLADSLVMENAIDYDLLEANRNAEIQDDLTKKLEENKGSHKIDSLRQAILDYVVGGKYETAKDELDAYVRSKRQYPQFIIRAERYKQHCVDLISAIDTKRNFPGIGTLSLSKQQELHEKVLDHFEELKHVLKQVEVLEKDQKLADVRSTVWVVKTFFNAVIFLMSFGFIYELNNGLGHSLNVVFNALVDDLINFTSLLF